VKGAYWDAEIKRTQQEGQVDYPVFTRKAHTDVSYLVCAQKLLAAPKQIYAEFATHNALTLAMVYQMAEQAFPDYQSDGQYEFQC
ncbi:proline dehydrogenase family protein, partial [Acinetobacter baumannii]